MQRVRIMMEDVRRAAVQRLMRGFWPGKKDCVTYGRDV